MSPAKSLIQLDYKSQSPDTRSQRKLPWIAAAMALATVLAAALLSMRDADGRLAPEPASNIAKTQQLQTLPLALPVRSEPPTLADISIDLPAPELLPPAPAVLPATAAVLDTPPEASLTLTVTRGDTLDALFRKNGLSIPQLHQILALPEARGALRLVKPGDEFRLLREGESVLELSRRLDEARTLRVSREPAGTFSAEVLQDVLEHRIAHAKGHIESSLFHAAKRAGVSDRLIMDLAGIFAWDIDFVLDIREGDAFVVLYEQVWREGEYLRDGEIVAAQFVNQGRTHRAIRFVDVEGKAEYYSPEGLSVRKAFLRAPVDFTRISSNFNLRRKHPVLNTIRAHKGVDYAAPTGTPIKAAGDGKVIFRGRKGGYGNCIILQHGANITTLYAHLSRYAKSLHDGSRVKQGQVIGYVGKTGLANGPHLHYEYRVAGVHRNPRTVELPDADPIRSEYEQDFLALAGSLGEQLTVLQETRVAAKFD